MKPVSERKLQPPRRKESTMRELILEDIRDGSTKETLRKIERKPSQNKIVESLRKRKTAVILEESPVLSDTSTSSIMSDSSQTISDPSSSSIIKRRSDKSSKGTPVTKNKSNEEVVLRRKPGRNGD